MYVCSKQSVLIFLHLKMSCFSFLKNVFSGHRISNWISFIHSFSLSLFFFVSTWKILCYFPLAPRLPWEICSHWFVLRPQELFFSSCYQDILSLVFRSLIMICLRMNFFGFVLFGDLAKFGNFPAIIYLSFFILNFIFNWFIRYNLHLIKCTHFTGTVWWVWTNVYIHVN